MNPITPFPTIELDCRTQQCPVPVLRLAKAAGEVGDGGLVLIRADDPAFPKDLRAWARSAGSRITRFDDHGEYFEAEIRIGNEPEPSPSAAPPAPTQARESYELPDLDAGPVSQTFDLRGQPADALIPALARACARAEPGATLAILVDEPSFPERLDAYLATADATLMALERRTDAIETRVRVEPPIAPPGAQAELEPVPPPDARRTEPDFSGYPGFPRRPDARPEPAPSRDHARDQTRALARPAPSLAPERCTLLVLHNDHEALLAALLIANGAAAAGMQTSVFFTFWGLNLLRGAEPNYAEPEAKIGLMQRLMKWMMPKGPDRQPLGQMHFAGLGKGMLGAIMREQQIMSLPELMHSAVKLGVRFTACTMSMSVMGIARRDLYPYPNLDYGGVASFVDDARNSSIAMVF